MQRWTREVRSSSLGIALLQTTPDILLTEC